MSRSFFPTEKTLSDANKTTIFSVGQSLNFGEERGPAITGEKIHTSVFESNTDSASGADGLSAELIPFSYSIIANHLSLIFNSCLSLGYFPVAWKRARICEAEKIGRQPYEDAKCFRPISVLKVLSKIFEKFLHRRLSWLSKEGDWISEAQHGFVDNKSTETAAHVNKKM